MDTGSEAVFGDSGEVCVTAVEEVEAPFVNVSVPSGGVRLLGLGATVADVAAVVGHENFLYYTWLTINKDT